MKKPNCTVKEEHIEILDKLAETRYQHRSEALRAAIMHLDAEVNGGNTQIEELIDRVESLATEVNKLSKKIDDYQSSQQPVQPISTELGHERENLYDVADDVMKFFNSHEEATVTEICDELATSNVGVREALELLIDRDWVTTTEIDSCEKFRLTTIT